MQLNPQALQSLAADRQADARREAAQVRAVRHSRSRQPRPDRAPPDARRHLRRPLRWAGHARV